VEARISISKRQLNEVALGWILGKETIVAGYSVA
jgi:hypothetical protein